MKSMFGRSLLRAVVVAGFVCFFFSARPVAAYNCEGGIGAPVTYEITIRYYNSSQMPVGWETYYCDGTYISHGTLSGAWIEETDIDCCTGQTQHGYFYLCPDGVYHTVTAVGDTNCS